MNIILASFGGIVPRYAAHQLGPISASVAHDVQLRNGRLEPWRERCSHKQVSKTNASFHLHGCCSVEWNEVVQAAEVAPDWGRFYISGRTDKLEAVVMDSSCRPSYFSVGVPTPPSPPVAHGDEQCERGVDARSYVYTYLNQWNEESAPSPASNIIRVDDGAIVSVTGIALPPEGYGIVAANIYRTATGFQKADGKVQKQLTDFLYVGTVVFPHTTFTDNVKSMYLGEALETEKVRMPPSGLRNVCALGGVVRLAGTTKNQVHLSENFQLHNWPLKYDLTLDANIVHMGAIDQRLYVSTDSIPYIIDVSSCEDMKCTPVIGLQTPLPDISCGHARSAITTPHGFFYSSPLGVVLITPNGQWHIITAKWFSENDWAQVRPETARFAYWEGFLFIVTDAVTLLLDINGEPYGDMKSAELSTLSDSPVDLEVSNTGKLFMLEDGEISVWNTAHTWRKFTWISRELPGGGQGGASGTLPDMQQPLGTMWSPVAAKIRTRDTEFTLITPIRTYQRKVLDERPFRLPRMGRHMWYKMQFVGTSPVDFAELGTAYFTVNRGS